MCIHCDLYGFTMGRILLFILPKETSTISRYQQNETKKASFVSQIDFSEMKRNVWHETLKNVVNVVLWAVWPVVLFNNWPFEVLKWNFAQQLITFAKENSQFCKIQLKTRKQIPKWQNLAKSGHAGPQNLKALLRIYLPGGFPFLRERLQLVMVRWQVFNFLHPHVLGGRRSVAAMLRDVS